MFKFLLRRVLAMVPIFFGGTFLAFALIALVPGNPARAIAGEYATPVQVHDIQVQLGLNRPFLAQYFSYLGQIAHFNLGKSVAILPGAKVLTTIGHAAGATISLAILVILFSVLVGAPLGILAAITRGSLIDRGITAFMSVAMAIPPFVLGPLLITLLAINMQWFPVFGYVPFATDPIEWLKHLALPALALGIGPAAEIARQVRASFVDSLDQSYVRTAEAKGLRPRRVIGKHVLKNASIPVVTVLGLQIGRILSGTVVVEVIFGIPGLGLLTFNAVQRHDFPIIQGVVLITIVVVIVVNLLVDLSYTYFDPKLRK
jgi:peptide/nickel transport system permease protein